MKTFQEFEQYLTGYGFVSCPLTEAQWKRCPGASAYARESDPREVERTMVAKTRRELDRIARKYSLEQLEKL